MCGVVAAFAYAGSAPGIDREELRKVRDHMAARGPDGAGEWFSADGRVGLGHRRLAIIDLSERGAQPMASHDGQLVITFNGEIYNYKQLRAKLQASGRVFATDSDTEVLLQLYEEHGTGMLALLRGMFAFALWDGRKRAMLLARDAFGIKPLYYSDDGRTARAASQVKALLCADVDARMEPAGHAGFLLWGSVPAPWTLYRGIRVVPAGHFMWIDEGGKQESRPFCDVARIVAEASREPARGSRGEALEALSHSLRATVDAHLVSDVPVGVFLSGGLDSAMLSAMARERSDSLRSLTLAFAEYAGTPQDESPHARAVALQLGTQHEALSVRQRDFAGCKHQLLVDMDQPSIDGVNTWFVARAAASTGLKVALSGLGGDELFASYPSFLQIPQLVQRAAPFSRAAGLGLFVRRLSEPLVRRFTSPKYAGLLEYGGSFGGAYLLRRGLHMPWELPRLMDPDMARAGWDRLQTTLRLADTCAQVVGAGRDRLAVSALEISWYMRHQLLVDADWAGMAHSLEIRVPFVDIDLLRESMPWFAAHPDLTKREVASRAAPQLPASLLGRPKTGFSIPVQDWLNGGLPRARGLRPWSLQVRDAHVQAVAGREKRRRVLVSTLAPGNGGVQAMTRFAVETLETAGFEPVLGFYATYSGTPGLSVPSFRLLQRRPGHRLQYDARGNELHAIGAWLPELEFTHYLPARHWRRLMATCDGYMAVSGNALAATPFHLAHKPYLAWIATDWDGDRRERARRFPWPRRLLDSCLNAQIIRRLETALMRQGRILFLSEHTARTLRRDVAAPAPEVLLPVPVDTILFSPKNGARVPGRIGFAGRFNDPRKNIRLLLAAAARMRSEAEHVHVVLMGDTPGRSIRDAVASCGLEGHVAFYPDLSRDAMRDLLQTLDVFVLPSLQEGLCIAALEALACGVPVVSTRCGGPEEFVMAGVSGALVDTDPGAVASAAMLIMRDTALRQQLSASGRKLIEDRYSKTRAGAILRQHLDLMFVPLASAANATAAATHPALGL
jgi:asparagine synthase (glutamine-hydrolysing)